MGANPYWYFVEYQADLQAALDQLRTAEFEAGRYYPAVDMLEFPLDPNQAWPGKQHASIDAAREAAMESGCASILDIERIGDEPDFCVAAPLEPVLLKQYFGTVKPTRELLEQPERLLRVFEGMERGQAVYVVVYLGEVPMAILFAGYSFD